LPNEFVISTGVFMGLRPTPGDEKRGLSLSGYHKTVIPTEAYPDFLPRRASNDHGCGSP
jgi:hypothetical protein